MPVKSRIKVKLQMIQIVSEVLEERGREEGFSQG